MADADRLRTDAAAIWQAAIAAVQPERMIAARLAIEGGELLVGGRPLDPPLHLDQAGRIVVVGAGKAAAGMAAGVETLLGADRFARHAVTGLVSVPAGCGRRLAGIAVRETRPAAQNLPTAAAVAATHEMLAAVRSLGPADIAVAVITGGGSALLCLPRPDVPLAEKVAVARFLAAAGADIHEINLVRQAVSDVKGGGLARACRAGRLLVLVLSDVIGDPLDVIASGPCMPVRAAPQLALAVLDRYGVRRAGVAPAVVALLEADLALLQGDLATQPRDAAVAGTAVGDTAGTDEVAAGRAPGIAAGTWTTPAGCRVSHLLLGGNDTALAAAATRARGLGYAVTERRARVDAAAETADGVGRRLAVEARALAAAATSAGVPLAVVEGGEATVTLPAEHGTGGRNQQTVVAAIAAMRAAGPWPTGLLLASIGTDGEDGPTTAAGGLADAAVDAAIGGRGNTVDEAVARCDALPLLTAAAGLVVTGPTGTNVADLRILLARPGGHRPRFRGR